MDRRQSNLFLHVNSEPSPDANPALWEHRLRQRRPISRNPFVEESTSDTGYGLAVIDSPSGQPPLDYKSGPGNNTNEPSQSSKEQLSASRKNHDREWGEQIPSWLNLFYDLAWTATFASLTSNNKFREPWDSVSYIVFFTTAWWLWVAQVSYNVDFYTDDWFHLLFNFLQLIIFGALAATTRGFDVSTYILHSPGTQELEPYDPLTVTPARYGAERLTSVSLRVIMFVLAFSRVLLLIQHLRVVIYGKLTAKSGRFPRRLLIVPASLVISAGLFFGAFVISSSAKGKEPHGAKLKYVIWAVALGVEVVAHVIRFQLEISEGIQLRSHGSIAGRLRDITAIILGEGINAISGTFYAVQQAPGFSGPTGTAIVCCGVIVFFLAYLYFEGAAPLNSVRRRAAWVMVHLTWLLSVILLLEGVKNQLLLSSFLGSAGYLMETITNSWVDSEGDEAVFNTTMRSLMLQAGLSYDEQYGKFADMITANISATPDIDEDGVEVVLEDIRAVWFLRVQLQGTFNTYTTFMENDSIPETTYSSIQKYLTDYNYTFEDITTARESPDGDLPHYMQILEELLHSSVGNARYIMALSGITFISLATLNLIQSWPRDRFHWGSIFSRYAMGFSMLLLLVLNVGKYQTFNMKSDQDASKQAGVFKWIDASWVLPTLALAYAVQFIIDTILVYLAVWYSKKNVIRTSEPEKFT